MKRIWHFLSQPHYLFDFDRPEARWKDPWKRVLNSRAGQIGGIAAWNALPLYCVATGNMVGGFTIFRHGRESSPALFWVYVTIVALAALLLDLLVVIRIASGPKMQNETT
jgi:hypothetical protein